MPQKRARRFLEWCLTYPVLFRWLAEPIYRHGQQAPFGSLL